MANVKCAVTLDDRDFLIKVPPETSVAALQHKIRTYLKIRPDEAIFLFFEYNSLFTTHETLHAGSRLMGQIRDGNGLDVQRIRVCRENCFGAWNKMWVRAKIEPEAGVYKLTIIWSYYGISHYDEVSVHPTVEAARAHLLDIRCGGHLVEEKKE